MKDEAFYKAQAQEARKMADHIVDEDLRQSWLQIAESYDALAEAARSAQIGDAALAKLKRLQDPK